MTIEISDEAGALLGRMASEKDLSVAEYLSHILGSFMPAVFYAMTHPEAASHLLENEALQYAWGKREIRG